MDISKFIENKSPMFWIIVGLSILVVILVIVIVIVSNKKSDPNFHLQVTGDYPGYEVDGIPGWCCGDKSGCPYSDGIEQCKDITKTDTAEGCLNQVGKNKYVLAQWEGGAFTNDGKTTFDSCLLWNTDAKVTSSDLYDKYPKGFVAQYKKDFPPGGKGPTKITRIDPSLYL